MHCNGLDARYDKAKPGRPRKIDSKLYKSIAEAIDKQSEGCGIKSNVWTGRLILIMLSGIFNIDRISSSTAYRTMHRINKSYRKLGRPIDHRTPSNEVKEEFKMHLGQKIRDAVATGSRVFWIDESHFSTKTIRGYTWTTRGLAIIQKINPFGKRCTCFAALGAGGILHHRYYERGNTDYMIYLFRVSTRHGKVLLIMDCIIPQVQNADGTSEKVW